jgi:hypothetical protein
MECSTTELRQHALIRTGALDQRIGREGLHKAGDPCHKVRERASTGKPSQKPK